MRLHVNIATGVSRKNGTPYSFRWLFLIEKMQVRFVTLSFHFLLGNEMKSSRLDGVLTAGGRFRIGKEVAKMGVAPLGSHFGPLHVLRVVRLFHQEIV